MYNISYVGDGTTNEFLFAFPFFQPRDVRVAVNGTLLETSQYRVIANEQLTGGTVVVQSAPAENATIDIFRQVELSRVVDYQPTEKIDPESLNADFNFLLAALQDFNLVNRNIIEWTNVYDAIMDYLKYTNDVVTDKLGGGGVLGLYNNLLSVLRGALPKLVNDYGMVDEPADTEIGDDYGIL